MISEASSCINLSDILAKITESDTDVEKPFSVDDAATAAVPTPTTAGAQLVKFIKHVKNKSPLNETFIF